MKIVFHLKSIRELLPLLEAGTSWEVSAFVSQIYLPSSSGSPCPVFFISLIFQHQFWVLKSLKTFKNFHAIHLTTKTASVLALFHKSYILYYLLTKGLESLYR